MDPGHKCSARDDTEIPMNLSRILQSVAGLRPAGPPIPPRATAMTYAELEIQVAAIAGALLSRHDLRKGDRVGIWMENCAEFFPVLFGVWRAGLAAVPINNKLHPKELQWILDNSEARLCIVTPDLAEKLAELPTGTTLPPIIATGSRDYQALLGGAPIAEAPTSPEDEAWLFYTSGTTGRPKGAVLTHRNLLFMVHAYYADIDYIGPDDTTLHAAPMTHGAGLFGLAFLLKGAHNIVVPGSFDPEAIFATFGAHRKVSFFAAPTMVSRLINHPLAGSADTRNLKTITYGGAPMYLSDLKRALELFGPKLFQIYGQGESPMTISGLPQAMHLEGGKPARDARLMSAGFARTGCAIRILDEDGRNLPPGEIGEIATRSDCVMRGYWNNPEANAKALRDGWLWTGDMGSLDATGILSLKDRSKDMIISGGSNIYPREIEEVLLTHQGVLECAVVSRPHADWGEEVIAFVVPRADGSVDIHGLDRLCLDNIARFKRPKGYRLVDSLPKNNYGKILKTELREKLKAES